MWKGHSIAWPHHFAKPEKPPKKKKVKIKKIKRGKITKKEMVQVRFARPISKEVHPRAPVEAIKGIGPKRGKKLRKKGISTAAEFQRTHKKYKF